MPTRDLLGKIRSQMQVSVFFAILINYWTIICELDTKMYDRFHSVDCVLTKFVYAQDLY